ncbi:MAG: GNAT family N-acetyltransferase [Fimbriimonadaceae bacterium]|nr:GNAT family N-acetyltransferase [Fimbriimonadaceae bacterium]
MRVAFHTVYPTAAAELWNRNHPAKYAICPELIRLNTVDSGLYDPGASVAELDDDGRLIGYIVVKRSASCLYKGPDPDVAHLSAAVFDDPTVGIDLFAHAKKMLLNRGLYQVSFGQDVRHFWPGCPADCAALNSFLTVSGFQAESEAVDLERDLSDYSPPTSCLKALEKGTSVRPLSMEDLGELSTFLEATFPGRWKADTLWKINAENRADFVYGLFVEGKIKGFAVTQDWTHHSPIGGGVWRIDLGENWGALGPIGIAPEQRGSGLGGALLGSALQGLKDRGARKTIIDWTTLTEFYGKHGFEVTRRYTPYSRRIDE